MLAVPLAVPPYVASSNRGALGVVDKWCILASMKYSRQDFVTGLECILDDPEMRSVSVFCGDRSDVKQRIRMTRRGKDSLIITMGKPNWRERELLKSCKKAKCKAPKVWFKFYKRK